MSKSSSLKKSSSKKTSDEFIKKIKNVSMTPIYIGLVSTLIMIGVISSIIHYINELQKCKCYNEKNKENYSNLTYILVIESIILTLFIINVLVIIGLIFGINSIKRGGADKNSIMIYLIVILVIKIIITIYFIYNVYKLSENIDHSCECSDNWVRYLLYVQTILMIIMIFGYFGALGNILIK